MNAGALAPQPLYLGPRGYRRFAVWHGVQGSARAGVVLCPPILHEYTRSYRLWALLAARLSAAGIACLRLDYFACGDSDGEDTQFNLNGAALDVELALRELRHRLPHAEHILLGIRAGAWPAWAAAAATAVDQLWLWQPIADGAAYLAHLLALDAAERASYERYPWQRARPRAVEPNTLMGIPCCASLTPAIAQARLPGARLRGDVRTIVLDAPGSAAIAGCAQRIDLPPTLCAWTNELDMGDCRLGREFGPVLATLVDALPRAQRIAAWTN